MPFSSAVGWWEEWQLRILVLGSLVIQCYLALFASARKKHNGPFFRFSIWLSYLGGDAVAIYALAVLFNRQRKLQYSSIDGSHGLEVLWAPILLWHLGGQVNISAYNIEDNELWTRHILTTVSQVTVAIYVFFKSWSSSADKRLLATAIVLFIIGLLKCFDKPSALKRASFNSIVTTFRPTPKTKTQIREFELEKYIQEARSFVQRNKNPSSTDSDSQSSHWKQYSIPDKLFADCAYVYDDRVTTLRSFWLLREKPTYEVLRVGLSKTFDVFYSKGIPTWNENRSTTTGDIIGVMFSFLIMTINQLLPIVPIGLFHASHKTAYKGNEIKVTFILLYLTYFLELLSYISTSQFNHMWSDRVAQRSLIGFLAWNKRHRRLMGIGEFFHCKGLLDTYFGFRQCHSSKDITMFVLEHVKAGWTTHITDIESYWRFSDSRGQWTLERNGGKAILLGSIEKPFDESIILWHVATEFCCFLNHVSDDFHAKMCRQISNYMMHLLLDNPEMLLPGSRKNLFTDAYDNLQAILQGDDLTGSDGNGLIHMLILKEELGSGFIQNSWVLAQELMRFGGIKMWEVIEGVWIEMLCFSAGRCRGYLHAKSLGSGGEFLSYISLLMSHAGLETYVERQQRMHLRFPKEERVKIVKQRIEKDANTQATGASSIHQGMAPVKDKEIAITALASQVNGQLEQEEDAASTSASRVECDDPASAIKIVVSP